MRPQLKQRILVVWKVLLLLLVVLILAGIAYEQIGERQDLKQFPQVGRSVDIGGRSLNIYCSGDGEPAVILDSGGSAPGYENLLLRRKIAQFTSTCWFDRAGLGWSDPSPAEQTSAAIADDLHVLLHAANVSAPYVLVGASFSGFNVRVFAGKFPAEVAGVVLVDSAHEDQERPYPRGGFPHFRLRKTPAGCRKRKNVTFCHPVSNTYQRPGMKLDRDFAIAHASARWSYL